jgi:hypothetical protein
MRISHWPTELPATFFSEVTTDWMGYDTASAQQNLNVTSVLILIMWLQVLAIDNLVTRWIVST